MFWLSMCLSRMVMLLDTIFEADYSYILLSKNFFTGSHFYDEAQNAEFVPNTQKYNFMFYYAMINNM